MATELFYFVTSLQIPARQGYLLEGLVKPPASLSTFLTLFHHQMDFAQHPCLPDNLAENLSCTESLHSWFLSSRTLWIRQEGTRFYLNSGTQGKKGGEWVGGGRDIVSLSTGTFEIQRYEVTTQLR